MVMLALADHADPNGECWPGMALLIDKTRLTDRQLRRVLNGLHDDGLISIEQRAIGRGKRPHYKMFPCQKADEMSDITQKADISDMEKRTFATEKADISDTNHSHVRREPIQQPTTEKERVANATPTPSVEPVSEKPQPKRKRRSAPREPAAPKHEAVVIYHELRGRWPNELQSRAIAGAVVDLELWRLVLEKWRLRGYNPVNVEGMLDWYKHPEKMTYRNGGMNGNHYNGAHGNYQPPEAAGFTAEEWAAYLADPKREPAPF